MALILADRVRETSTTTGTGALSLAGAVVGYQTFSSAIGNTNTCYYAISNPGVAEWEVGIGTYATSGNTLTRTTILKSSNSNAAVNFSAGTKDVFVTYPAGKSVYQDASGNVTIAGGLGVGGSAAPGSTGLAVTGTLSATGALTFGASATAGYTATFSNTSTEKLKLYLGSGYRIFENDAAAQAGWINSTYYIQPTSAGTVATFSSTGLAVTGTLSATGANVSMTVNSSGAGEGAYKVTNGATFIGALAAAGWIHGNASQNFGIQAANSIEFATNNSATTSMTLDTSGNLGIGTSSPGYKLDVAGTVNVVNGSNGRINIGATNNYLYGDSSGNFIVGTSGSDKLQLNTSGNLGLGVTPSAWSTGIGLKALQVSASGCFYSYTFGGNNFTAVTDNSFINSAGNSTYVVTNTASQYRQTAGAHQWFQAASGTAGNAITFTQAMTLDSSGNLGIGTTTPDIFSRGYGRIVGINDSGSSGAALEINSASSYSAVELGRGGVRKALFTAQTTGTEFGNLEAVPLIFLTNSTERMRIDSSGNLGLGVTPSAWESGTKAYQISSAGGGGTSGNSFNMWGRADSIRMWTNAYFDGSSYVRQVAASVVPTNINVDSDGSIAMQSAPSGGAGSTFLSGNITAFFALKKDNTLALQGGTLSSGTGISFPATQSASTDANTLDDYEEGTWTPAQGSGLTVVGAFSSSGRYTKIGRAVNISGRLYGATSIATTAGTVMMTGLPFTVFESTAVGAMTNGSINILGGVGAFSTLAYSATTIGATAAIDFSFTYSV